MGSAHARVYSQLKECELAAICDSNREKKHLAKTYNCKFFEDIKDLQNPSIDILDQQANLFARELLMPEENMQKALHKAGYYPPVIYKEHHLNLMPFEEYNTRLAERIHDILQVPTPWICYRLVELGHLQNQAEKKALSHSA